MIHKKSGSSAEPLLGTGRLWKTCLREILFLDPWEGGTGADAFPGLEAHRFLVEICSGLHSPLFGETEIFGQFRAFRAAQGGWDTRWIELLDAVEEDVRKVRRTHLVDIGSQSYGSLARRHLPDGEPVVIVGGGHLAQELLPWLGGRDVKVAVRDPAKVKFAVSISLGELTVRNATQAHWLIAAPVSNEQLAEWWDKNPARTVLDFRGDASFEPGPESGRAAALFGRYYALRALFGELECVRELHARKRDEALAYVATLSQRRGLTAVHRPYGWEDAFA